MGNETSITELTLADLKGAADFDHRRRCDRNA